MTDPFIDWIEEALPGATVEGHIISIPGDGSFLYDCTVCGGTFKSKLTEEDGEEFDIDELICDVCFETMRNEA
jgi:hypothetical protein